MLIGYIAVGKHTFSLKKNVYDIEKIHWILETKVDLKQKNTWEKSFGSWNILSDVNYTIVVNVYDLSTESAGPLKWKSTIKYTYSLDIIRRYL